MKQKQNKTSVIPFAILGVLIFITICVILGIHESNELKKNPPACHLTTHIVTTMDGRSWSCNLDSVSQDYKIVYDYNCRMCKIYTDKIVSIRSK